MVGKLGWVVVVMLAGCLGVPANGPAGDDVTPDQRDGRATEQARGADTGPADDASGESVASDAGLGDEAAQDAVGNHSADASGDDAPAGSSNATAGSSNGTSGSSNATAGSPNATTHEIAWRSLDRGVWSSYHVTGPQLVVADDDAAWAALWDQHQDGHDPPAARPAVDMTTEVVVVLFLGTQEDTGHEVEVMDVVWDGADWEVHYEATDHGGNGCMTGQARTDPYHFIAVARSSPLPGTSLWMDAANVYDCP